MVEIALVISLVGRSCLGAEEEGVIEGHPALWRSVPKARRAIRPLVSYSRPGFQVTPCWFPIRATGFRFGSNWFPIRFFSGFRFVSLWFPIRGLVSDSRFSGFRLGVSDSVAYRSGAGPAPLGHEP